MLPINQISLDQKIDNLRRQLETLFAQKQSLTDPRVIALSHQLDEYIRQAYDTPRADGATEVEAL